MHRRDEIACQEYYGPYWDYPYFEGGFEGDEDWEGGDDDY